MAGITLKDIKEYFGYQSLSDFSADWKGVDAASREQIKTGIENGSLTY